MSPSSEKKFLKRLWDKDKVFDSILALILPCKLHHSRARLLVTVSTKHHIIVMQYGKHFHNRTDSPPHSKLTGHYTLMYDLPHD